MRFDGILNAWNDERGFGFIQPKQGGEPIFVHIKAFGPGTGRPQLNQPLSFEVEIGPRGKRAKNVQLLRARRNVQPPPSRARAQWGTATLFALPAFLAFYLAVAIFWRPPLWFAGVYLGASLITFLAYARDKAAAASRSWRTPESTLHFLAIVGGWPGALLAQQYLRHKSTKQAFRAVFWATVLLNLAGFALLCSPMGRSIWASVA